MASWNPCCCISLRCGCFLIGILEIVFSITLITVELAAIWGLATIHRTENDVAMQQVKKEIQQNHPEVKDKDPEAVFVLLYVVLSLYCFLGIFQVIFGSILIHGVRHARPSLVKLWLIFRASCQVFAVIFTIAVAVAGQKKKTEWEIAVDVISLLLGQYFLYVVYRFYTELVATIRNQHRPRPHTPK